MAALKEKSLSLGHLTGTERNTFTKRREHGLKKRPVLLQSDFSTHQHLRAMQLQQHWKELRERELTAQQHNRQLLQQFEEAQDTLREMLTLTAAMKTIRTEYERYLEESAPRWQQQLKEKRKAAQMKRMEEYLRSCLKNAEEPVAKSSADRLLFSQGPTAKPQIIAAPQKHYSQNSHLDYNQDGSLPLPYVQSSWQTNPQSQVARFPIRAPYKPQGSSHGPPSFLPPPIFPHPHPFHLAHHHPWPRQNPPGWASPQPDYPRSWTAGAAGIPSGSEALWGRLYTEEPPPERGVLQAVGEEGETSRAQSTKRESGGGSSSRHFSQELDIKPVRLSGGQAESSESSRESSREERKKREKRGRSRRTSSESGRTSSAVVTAALTVAQSSESDTSSEKGRSSTSRRRRRRCGGLAVGSPRTEKVVKDGTRSEGNDSGRHKEESQSTGEEVGSPNEESRSEKAEEGSPDDKSEGYREESGSGSVSAKTENGDEIEEQESSSSEHSSVGEKSEEEEEHEKDDGDAAEKEDGQRDEEQEEGDVKDEASERKNTTEEEEEETEEQESEEEGDKDGENGKLGSASSPDEEVDEDEGQTEEDEEEKGRVEEERDSEDSIISPQEKSKKMHVIPEEACEDDEEEEEEEGRKIGSSDDDFSDEDIEHLLALQERSQRKEEKEQRADEKPKAICDNVGIFQVEQDRRTKSDHQSDSDEFDHFYD